MLSHLPRPSGFREVRHVSWAEFRWEGPWGEGDGPRPPAGARAAGLRYERKVHRRLLAAYGSESSALYLPAQWIIFREGSSPAARWAQPDGLLIDLGRGLVTIVEIKLRHMDKTWWWCRGLYEPLLRHLFPSGWSFACLEITRFYDPGIEWPEPLRLVREPDALRAGQFGCHIWSGSGA
jgi:hypothetical protein